MDKHAKQDDGRNIGAKKQNSKKRFEKNENAGSVEGVFVLVGFTARQCLKLAGPTWTNQYSFELRRTVRVRGL